MFGKNKVYQKKHLAHLPDRTLKLVSHFLTKQGEGYHSGVTAEFLRTSHCNLTCSWCDTYFDAGDVIGFDQIFDIIKNDVDEFYGSRKLPIPRSVANGLLLVITGGEPSIQPHLKQFLIEAHFKGYRTQIESNGVIEWELPPLTYAMCSPKTNEQTRKYILPHPENLKRADGLKFVISESMEGYTDIPDFALEWKEQYQHRHLFVSPMNMYLTAPEKVGDNADIKMRSEIDERISFWTPNLLDPIQNQKNHEHAAYIAMKHDARLSLQTHLYASLP